MSTGLYSHTTRATGTILTAAIYNSDHQNHITNLNPTMSGALSDNLSEHQSDLDPGGLGTEVLAANLAEELRQIRFCIRRIIGEAQWYVPPLTDLASVGGVIDDLEVAQTVALTGNLTPPTITANQNNYAPTGLADAFCLRLAADASRTITGLTGGANGRVILLTNVGAAPSYIQLASEDAASTAANRFSLGPEGVLDINSGEAVMLRYDGVSSRWRPVSTAGMNNPVFNIPQVQSLDLLEIAPTNPGANIARLYAKDVAGVTRLAYRDNAGTETIVTGPVLPDHAYAELTASTSISTIIAPDGSIPQQSEGTEILSATITPSNVSSKVKITVSGRVIQSVAPNGGGYTIALFVGAAAPAIYAHAETLISNHTIGCNTITTFVTGDMNFTLEHAPATTSPVTYKVRIGRFGTSSEGNLSINSTGSVGATQRATLSLDEVFA